MSEVEAARGQDETCNNTLRKETEKRKEHRITHTRNIDKSKAKTIMLVNKRIESDGTR
jgi:hypothetical protein